MIPDDDKFDLRPQAARVVDAAMDLRRQSGSPVFLLMGENHDVPSHRLLQSMVVTRLKDKIPELRLAAGFELAGGRFPEIMHRLIVDAPAAGIDAIAANDHDGRRELDFMLAFDGLARGDSSMKQYHLNLKFNRISFACNDVPDNNIAAEDYRTARTAFAKVSGVTRDADGLAVTPDSPFGMHLRNIVLTRNMLSHQHRSGADLYVQHCGTAHLFGEKSRGIDYSGSLTAMLRSSGATVLPVFIEEKDMSRASIELEKAIGGPHLFLQDMPGDKPASRAAEDKLIERIARSSGFALPVWDLQKEIPALRNDLVRRVPQWFTDARQNSSFDHN